MFVEICLTIIAATLVMLVIILIRISSKMQVSLHQVETDLNRISTEISHLSNTLQEFVSSDLYKLSEETSALIGKLTDLASNVSNKSRSLNFLLKLFGSLNPKMNLGLSSSDDLSSKCETIPQILKWIATSVFLVKTTREFVKNYEKS